MHIFRIDERLFGGQHPGLANSQVPNEVNCFIDLTEWGDAKYAANLPETTRYYHFPVPDLGVPTVDGMKRVVETICRELDAGSTVYLHCHSGCGRTGTVAGCYLAYRYQLDGMEAFLRLQECFSGSEKDRMGRMCPETEEQLEFINKFAAVLKKNLHIPVRRTAEIRQNSG